MRASQLAWLARISRACSSGVIDGTVAGIGRAAAEAFAAEGALVFGWHLDGESASETVELVEKTSAA